VNVDLLKEAMNPTHRISQVLLAEKLGIHRNTLRAKLKENSINSSFTEMSEDDLDHPAFGGNATKTVDEENVTAISSSPGPRQ
jgi:hypothetical protein